MLSTLRRGVKINFPFRKQTAEYTSGYFSRLIDIHPNVQEALLSKRPVVALESTIITHGMPYPHNLQTALTVEGAVVKEGSTPATIAIIDGRIKVGLEQEQLERLANSDASQVVKCSRRDLAYIISRKLCGGTTVAGTLIIANLVGIKVFATGGLGGVHREGHITMDISADLIELGKTPVAVVSSGVKSILDIPRTLEYLETQGVCVASYQSPTLDFPAFYTRSSGVKAPYNLSGPEEAAALINSSLELNLRSGILIGVPIPVEHAVPEEQINEAIEKALIIANKTGIIGKEVTPFVLKAITKITEGKSLNSNIALIENNATVASQIAVRLQKIRSSNLSEDNGSSTRIPTGKTPSGAVPVVVGASILDMCLQVNDNDLQRCDEASTYTIQSTPVLLENKYNYTEKTKIPKEQDLQEVRWSSGGYSRPIDDYWKEISGETSRKTIQENFDDLLEGLNDTLYTDGSKTSIGTNTQILFFTRRNGNGFSSRNTYAILQDDEHMQRQKSCPQLV